MSIGLSYEELAATPVREMSMGLALSWQAAREPDRPALSMGEVTYTRLELDQAANRMARTFASLGVRQGSKVAVLLQTGPMHHIVCFGLWKIGATVIPLSWRLVDSELEKILGAADPELVVGVEPGRLPGFRTLPPDIAVDPTVPGDPMPEVLSPIWKASTSGGSTGIPKLIWDRRPSLIHPFQPMALLKIDVDDTILHPAAAYHNSPFCQVNWALCWGANVVLMGRFDAEAWLREVERHRIRWAYLVPTMMSRILNLPRELREAADVSSIRIAMHMAAPCPDWVKAGWIEWLGPERIWEVYAGTEGYGSTLLSGEEWLAHRGTVGQAPAGAEVRDEEGRALPPGEVGALYFPAPLGNRANLAPGYYTYGDMGWVDADGYLYIADRRTDMIVSGGGNLYPAEIEAAIEQYPGVVAAAVIGLPDADLGSVPHAIVELEPEARQPTPQELLAFLGEKLARTKHPRSVEFTREPLRDDAGKMRRSRLRQARLSAAREPARA